MRRFVLAAAVAVLSISACSASPASKPAAAAAPSSSPAPSITPSGIASPSGVASAGGYTITLSGKVRNLPPGPFKITPVKCGRYTAAEQDKFGTSADGGFIFKYTNVSNTLTDQPNLEVNFLKGSTVVGNNVTGHVLDVDPGQSAEASVNAVSGGGGSLSFDTCEMMDYGLIGGSGFFAPRP